MKVKLYEKFNNWYRGGRIFIYSDPHFADDEMQYIRKNYIGDQEQIDGINKLVHKNDTIIFLGDIGDVSWVAKLKAGYKVLIMGNHDAGASNYKRKNITMEQNIKQNKFGVEFIAPVIVDCDNHLFDEVYEGPLFISEKILLSHEPIDLPFVLNIHGHDHSNWFIGKNKHFNTCAEWIDYTPVALDDIVKETPLSGIDSIHRMTIDGAIRRKEKCED